MLYANLGVNEKGHLTVAGRDTVCLAKTYGTVLMVMDEMVIRNRCRIYRRAMEKAFPKGSMPLFASKALSFKRIYEIMREESMGVDVVSCGELFTAYKAGFPMDKVFFHGNSKTDEDIRFAMDCGLGYFVCDNVEELTAIEQEAASRGICQKVLLRLTPGIDPHTNEKISTGKVDSKFGAAIETGQAEELTLAAMALSHVELVGFHCHIGSQIFEHTPFCDGAEMMLRFYAHMQKVHGCKATVLNLGGGMGVPYTEAQSPVDYEGNILRVGQLLSTLCKELDVECPTILMEPGRSIVADAGVTLYRVNSTKSIPGFKNYVAVDGGMTDNPRYTLYGAEYTVLPASRMEDERDFVCTVAGRCCESGDILQENVPLPKMERGDILAVLTTGAYNYSMASNYNRIPRPAVVMLGEHGDYVAVKRESFEDLIRNDV